MPAPCNLCWGGTILQQNMASRQRQVKAIAFMHGMLYGLKPCWQVVVIMAMRSLSTLEASGQVGKAIVNCLMDNIKSHKAEVVDYRPLAHYVHDESLLAKCWA